MTLRAMIEDSVDAQARAVGARLLAAPQAQAPMARAESMPALPVPRQAHEQVL